MGTLSRIANDKRILFREVFTPASIAANHGQITGGVTFGPGGIAHFDGTGYITYAGNKDLANKSQFTIRMKAKQTTTGDIIALGFNFDATHFVSLMMYTDNRIYGMCSNGIASWGQTLTTYSDVKYREFVICFDGTGATDSDRMKIYVDGVFVSSSFAGTIPSASPTIGTFEIGRNHYGSTEGSFELVEIYDSALTAEEVLLLHDNRLYSGFVNEGLVLHADYLTGSSRNLAREYGDNTVLNSQFENWTGDDPDDWSVSAEDANNYVTEDVHGARLVSDGTWIYLSQSVFEIGKTYRYRVEIGAITGSVKLASAGGTPLLVISSSGIYELDFIADHAQIQLGRNAACDAIIKSISVQEVLESTDTNVLYKHGLGASFEQATSEINYGVTNVVGTQSFTLETVFASSLSNPSANQAIMGKNWATGGAKGYGFILGEGAGLYKRIRCQIRNDAEGFVVNVSSGVDYVSGILTFMSIVRDVDDGVDGSLKIYVSGVLKGSDVGGRGITLENPTEDFVIGNNSGGLFDFYGIVSYTRMQIGKANSAFEVRQNYQAAIDSGYLNG